MSSLMRVWRWALWILGSTALLIALGALDQAVTVAKM